MVVGCIRNEQEVEYRDLVNNFMEWCRKNHLFLSVTKTKGMVVDFRRRGITTSPITMGQNT